MTLKEANDNMRGKSNTTKMRKGANAKTDKKKRQER
jgi:hypothetical protein